MEILSFIPAINKCNVTGMLEAKLCYLQLPVNGHSINQRIWEAVVQIMCKHTLAHTHTHTLAGATQPMKVNPSQTGSVSKVIMVMLFRHNALQGNEFPKPPAPAGWFPFVYRQRHSFYCTVDSLPPRFGLLDADKPSVSRERVIRL